MGHAIFFVDVGRTERVSEFRQWIGDDLVLAGTRSCARSGLRCTRFGLRC